jgi:hypothetical protein
MYSFHVFYDARTVQVGEIIVWPTNQAPGAVVKAGASLGAKTAN